MSVGSLYLKQGVHIANTQSLVNFNPALRGLKS